MFVRGVSGIKVYLKEDLAELPEYGKMTFGNPLSHGKGLWISGKYSSVNQLGYIMIDCIKDECRIEDLAE